MPHKCGKRTLYGSVLSRSSGVVANHADGYVEPVKKFTLLPDVTRMRFSAGSTIVRAGDSVSGANARWNCSSVLFDPRHGVAVLSPNDRRNEALQLRDSREFHRARNRLSEVRTGRSALRN